MAVFSWLRFRSFPWAIVWGLVGIMVYLSNQFQEEYEVNSFLSSLDRSAWHRPVFLLLLEEGSEIFGSLCFIVAISLYAINKKGWQIKKLLSKESTVSIFLNRKKTAYTIAFFLILLFIGDLFLFNRNALAKNFIANYDDGLPQNWFPSALAFIISTISLYQSRYQSSEKTKRFYLKLFLTSLLLSLFYGSNLYAYAPSSKLPIAQLSVQVILWLSFIFIGSKFYAVCSSWLYRANLISGGILFGCAIFLNSSYASLFMFAALSIFFVSFTWNILRPTTSKNFNKKNPTSATPL